jgi:hypothetical protein
MQRVDSQCAFSWEFSPGAARHIPGDTFQSDIYCAKQLNSSYQDIMKQCRPSLIDMSAWLLH